MGGGLPAEEGGGAAAGGGRMCEEEGGETEGGEYLGGGRTKAAAAATHDDGYAGESESVSERAGRARGDKVGIVVAHLPKRATANLNSSSAL